MKLTRLSCHRFRVTEVGLWLSLLAYNLANLWRRLVLPTRVAMVADQPAATAGENPGAFDKACPVLLVVAGGEPT